MSEEGWKSPRLNEDLQFKLVSGPPDYNFTTDKPVRYVAVASDKGVLGYLWAADADDAAGYVPRVAGGGDAMNAGVAWCAKLTEAKAQGLSPSQAIILFSNESGTHRIGHVVPNSQAEAPSLEALSELAARG